MAKAHRLGGTIRVIEQMGETLAQMDDDDAGFEKVPISSIELDPENPRHLGLDFAHPDVIAADDPRHDEKKKEVEALKELSDSIKGAGLLQPIRVYRTGNKFTVAFGERRVLASVLAGKTTVDAIILKSKPKTLRRQQMVENMHRRGLSLHRRLDNLRAVMAESASLGEPADTPEHVQQITGVGQAQAYKYLAVLAGPKDVLAAVERGAIDNLVLADAICRIKDPAQRAAAIHAGKIVPIDEHAAQPKSKRRGPVPTVKFGRTPHTDVARRIIEAVAGTERYAKTDWTDPKEVTKAFKSLLAELEAGSL